MPAVIAADGLGEVDRLAVQRDRAGIAPVDPEQDPGDLGPAGADEPGEADDLARADREADVAEDPDPGQPVDLEQDLADRRRDLREERHGAARPCTARGRRSSARSSAW